MSDSKEHKLPKDQQATWPLLDRLRYSKNPAQSGEELMSRMGDTVRSKDFSDSGAFGAASHFTAGDIIADKYQIIQLLSRGNMGVVYQAKHILLDKIVAIKLLAPEKPLEDAARQRFQREAHAASALTHPHIICVYDFGVLENGALYLAMEYLEGETLATRLAREGRLDLDTALPIFKQVCSALDWAHKQGVVHRDLKPSNIMLVKDYRNEDRAIVIDFSIAKFTRKKPNQKTITQPGQIFGSPLYMSPEQCQGKKPDHRSDIYSTGCLIYETLCGASPLSGDSMLATIYKHVNELPTPFSEYVKDDSLPKEVQAVVFKALAKQPENRYESAGELARALEHLSKHEKRPNNDRRIIPVFTVKWWSRILISIVIPLLLFTFFCILLAAGVPH